MNVPKLRFKEFNDELSNHKFKDICTFFSGGTPTSSNKEYYNGDIPFIRSGEIYSDNTELFINQDAINNSSAKLVNKGDLLLALYGATSGNVAISKIDGAINQAILCINPQYGYSKVYIKYLLENKKETILKTFLQGGQGNLSAEIIKNLNYSFPQIEEQEKIGDFLSLLDKKIEDLKLFKKGLNKNIFSNFNAKYKIDELIKEYNQKTSKNNQFEVLSSTANGIILQNEYFNKQAASLDNTGYKIVPFGFITYRSMSDTGEFHFNIQNITENGIVSPAYPVFEINEDIVDKTYFIYYINENKSFKNKILSLKEGGTRYALSMSKFKEINLDLPPLEFQKKCSKLLNTYNRKSKNEENKLNKLQKLKKGLMQNMFV